MGGNVYDEMTSDSDVTMTFSVKDTFELTIPAGELAELAGVDLDKVREWLKSYNDEHDDESIVPHEDFDPDDNQLTALREYASKNGDVTNDDFDIDSFDLS